LRTRLLFGVLILALAAATVFAIWPVVGGAPWLTTHESPPQDTPRYTVREAVGFVRAALAQEIVCTKDPKSPHLRWAALFLPDRGSWLVSAFCTKEEGPPLEEISSVGDRWYFFEESGRVIPITEQAGTFMRPPTQ